MIVFRTTKSKGSDIFVAFLVFAVLKPVFMRLLKLHNANIYMVLPYGRSRGSMLMILSQVTSAAIFRNT